MSTQVHSTKGGPPLYTRVDNSVLRHGGGGPAVAYIRDDKIHLNEFGAGMPSYCVTNCGEYWHVTEGANPGGPLVFRMKDGYLYEDYGAAWLRVDDNDYMLLAAAGAILRDEHDMRITPGGWVPDSLTSYAKTPEGSIGRNPHVDPLPDPGFDFHYRDGYRRKTDTSSSERSPTVRIEHTTGNTITPVRPGPGMPENDDWMDDHDRAHRNCLENAIRNGDVDIRPFTPPVIKEKFAFPTLELIVLPVASLLLYWSMMWSWFNYLDMDAIFIPFVIGLVHWGTMIVFWSIAMACTIEIMNQGKLFFRDVLFGA